MTTRRLPDRRVPPTVDLVAAWAWRLLVIGAAVVAIAYVVARLRLVLLPVGVAILIATVLVPPARWLVGHRVRPLLATWVVFAGSFAVIGAVGAVVSPPLAEEFGDLGPTLSKASDDLEDWLVDGPPALERATVDGARGRLGQSVEDLLASEGALLDGAALAAELVTGILLSIIIAFFLVKDGGRIQDFLLQRAPADQRDRIRSMATASWCSLRGYLSGAAILGVVEATAVGLALALTGSSVVAPVAVLTFVAAFVPFVGAVVAGVVTVLVSLVASGTNGAVVVAIVVLVVQQLDNEVLAPFIYSRVLHLHPLVVILVVTTGAAVGGVIGAFLAVPVTAAVVSAIGAIRDQEPVDDTGRSR